MKIKVGVIEIIPIVQLAKNLLITISHLLIGLARRSVIVFSNISTLIIFIVMAGINNNSTNGLITNKDIKEALLLSIILNSEGINHKNRLVVVKKIKIAT